MAEGHSPWFEPTRDYTLRLVGIRSVSPSAAENDVAREVVRILGEDGLESAYAAIGLDPIEGDPVRARQRLCLPARSKPANHRPAGAYRHRADRRLRRIRRVCP